MNERIRKLEDLIGKYLLILILTVLGLNFVGIFVALYFIFWN